MATIAFCGTGMMGGPMAMRLRGAGHTVRVWNRTPSKAAALMKDGGVACPTPADAADPASEVHLMLANDDAVEQVLFASDGVLRGLQKGALVVDHSTVSVLGVAARAQRLKDGGWRFLQAPVFAGPSNVAKGEGTMLIGGAQETYASARPVLELIIEKHWYVGPRERDAAAYKLMGNSMLVNVVQALAEFFAIGRACGIEPDDALKLFERFDPGRTIAIRGPRMAHGDYAAAFTAAMAAKDVDLMIRAARDGGADVPGLELAQQRLLRLIKSGHGDLDLAALGLVVIPPARAHDGQTVAAGEG